MIARITPFLRQRLRPPLLDLFLLALLAGLLLRCAYSPFAIDDAPITWRYAENLAEGRGMVYNHGERVQGTSTPLFTGLLAVAHWIGLSVGPTSQAVGILCTALAVGVTYQLTLGLSSRRCALLAGILLLVQGTMAAQAAWGMETGLYTLLIVLALLLYDRGNTGWAYVVAALCLLTRLDGLLVGGVLTINHLIRNRRPPWKEATVYLLLTLPWFLFAQLYFGSVFPQSMIAKQGHPLTAGAWWMLRVFLTPPWPALLPFVVLGASLSLQNPDRRTRLLPLLSWAALYVTAYTVVHVDRYEWYITPMIPALAVLSALGIDRLLGWISRLRREGGRNWAVALSSTLILLLLLGHTGLHGIRTVRYWRGYLEVLEQVRIEIGRTLDAQASPDAMVATGPIGHVGYYSRRYVVDLGGLVTPYAASHSEAETIDYFQPQYVTGHNWRDYQLQSAPYIESCYDLVQVWEETEPLVGPYFLFRRRASCR